MRRLHGGNETAKRESVWNPVVVFLRGDHQVNETKLLGLIKANELRPMQAEELERYIHGPAGFLGPIGLVRRENAWRRRRDRHLDKALEGRQNMVCGANKLDYHYRNVTPGRDFHLDRRRGCAQCRRRRKLPPVRFSIESGEGCRSGPHLQAGL